MVTAQRNIKNGPEVPRRLLLELKHNLVMRQVSSGIELLETHKHLFTTISAGAA